MYKPFSKRIKIFFLSLFLMGCSTVLTDATELQKNSMDLQTPKWGQQYDILSASLELYAAYDALALYVQKIYNAYVPYTRGEGFVMRERVKVLMNLIRIVADVENILMFYKEMAAKDIDYDEKIKLLKKHIKYYYFNNAILTLYGKYGTITMELMFSFESLCDSNLHPDFIKITKFNKKEAEGIINRVERAIHIAVATIPGGAKILTFK